MQIIAYRGRSDSPPQFIDTEAGTVQKLICALLLSKTTFTESFFTLCSITGFLRGVQGTPLQGPRGRYYFQEIDVVLSFGLTEIKAQLAWKHKVKLILSLLM